MKRGARWKRTVALRISRHQIYAELQSQHLRYPDSDATMDRATLLAQSGITDHSPPSTPRSPTSKYSPVSDGGSLHQMRRRFRWVRRQRVVVLGYPATRRTTCSRTLAQQRPTSHTSHVHATSTPRLHTTSPHVFTRLNTTSPHVFTSSHAAARERSRRWG